ncbi:DUF7544 domain-containing protein [Terriglobus aquaticus]|uniref:DUF4013 domain-containing protein n=1 Tax=Terriglobus aquaticus TaxID=940139 RepID=A0ABW9KPD3_9BACT|nr:hypothetical protein [Terriglobus aquaticus]
MRVYSAGEAIGPAWEHTKALMWRDRRWGRLLKLALVAFGAELGTSFNFNLNGFRNHGTGHAVAAVMAGVAVVVLFLALIFFVVLLYLGSRLQLVQFDILLLRDPMVAPAWERHGPHTWRWAGLKVVIMIGTVIVLLPLLIPAIPIFVAFFKAAQPTAGSTPVPLSGIHWGAFFVAFAEVFAIVIAAVLLIRFVTSLVLPGVALEDLRFGDALRRGWDIFRTDVPGMLWFAVLQPLFLMLMGLMLGLGLLLMFAVLALPFGLLGYLVWHSVHAAGTAAWFLMGTLGVVAGVIILAIMGCAYLATAGTLLMFARAWSLYFLGGRYPLLGQYLEPGPAVPVWTPPPSLPRDEDSGGPGFPANPALA